MAHKPLIISHNHLYRAIQLLVHNLPFLFLTYARQLLSRGLYNGCSQRPQHSDLRCLTIPLPHLHLCSKVTFLVTYSWPLKTAIPHTWCLSSESCFNFHHTTYQPTYFLYILNLHNLSFMYHIFHFPPWKYTILAGRDFGLFCSPVP